MDATVRFAEVVRRPAAAVPLDQASALIAAHAYPEVEPKSLVASVVGQLDEIADDCPDRNLVGLARHLFVGLGFQGDTRSYYDPRNSYVTDVLERRLGIPITLSLVTMEVGRRLGLELSGVGMPGHFLVGDDDDPDTFLDPFAGGVRLDRSGAEARFHATHGADAPFAASFLDPVGPHDVVRRMLTNLMAIFRAGRDRANLLWVLRLRTLLPDAAADDHRELASVLAANGDFVPAAVVLETVAGDGGDDAAVQLRGAARRLRARLN